MAQASEIKKQYKKRTLFQETWRRLTKTAVLCWDWPSW